jgi:hypothetical protein
MAGFDTNDYGFVRTDNIFKGGAPTPTWDTKSDFGVGYGGVPSYTWGSTGGLNTGLINDISYGTSGGSSGPDWLGAGINALNKALAYKQQNSGYSPSSSREERGYGSNAPAVSRGKGYTMYMPTPTQKSTQTGGSRGIGGTIGTLAGAGVGFLAGGPAGAGLGATIGGAGGSLFG